MTTVFDASLWGFISYVIGFAFRYALIAGGVFALLHLWKRREFFVYKIQQHWPTDKEVKHEILWSMSNAICTGLFSMLLYYCINEDMTRMYFEFDERGLGYFILSIVVGTLGFDTWFYWLHRLLHTKWLFKHAHSIHHRVSNPTALASFAHHPIETFGEDFYFLFLVFLVPMHPLAMGICGLHAFGLAIWGHSGYEVFPRGFTRHKIFGWHNTATHHNMHHSHVNCNYSLYFNHWDRIMGTNHSEYHEHFDTVKNRLVEPAEGLPRTMTISNQ